MRNYNKIVNIIDNELKTALLIYNTSYTIRGINLFQFADPVKALEHLKINRKDYAIMISDLRMPVITGVRLLKAVKDLNPLARTNLMTAYESDDNLIQEYSKKEIINSFLKKPIELTLLPSEDNKQVYSSEKKYVESLLRCK